jgi:multiple sugar transport system permease protein
MARRRRKPLNQETAGIKILFVSPTIILLMIVALWPFFYAIDISLTNLNITLPGQQTKFIGLANYQRLFLDERAWNAFKNTGLLITLVLGAEAGLGLILSYLIYGSFGNSTAILALLLFPILIPKVTAGLLWRLIYHPTIGLANYLLGVVGLPRALWIFDRKLAFFSIVITDLWQWLPFMIIIGMSGLRTVPAELFDAAAVDGASEFRKFRHVALPLILPIYLIGLLFRMIDVLRTFDVVRILTRGGPGTATETVDIYAYLEGLSKGGNIGYASAMALVMLALTILFTVVIVNRLQPVELKGGEIKG